MERTIDTKYGEVTVRNAMFDIDGTTLEEGIEIKNEDVGLIEIHGRYDIDELTQSDVEQLIAENF
jgi:hypothetical protein